MWPKSLFLAVLLLAVSGCAVHKPQTYRLVPTGNSRVLVPPGVLSADTSTGTVALALPKGHPPCRISETAIAASPQHGQLRLSVTRATLTQQPPGWLTRWAAAADSQGCVAPGAGADLARRVLESVPLDPAAAYTLLHADSVRLGFVDIGIDNRLQSTAPIMKDDASPDALTLETATVSGAGNSLSVDVRSSDNLLGVETAWYALQPKPQGGATIVPLSAERRINGNTEAAAGPLHNYFQFAPRIGYYRLIYKADLTEQGAVTEIIVGAPSQQELEQRTQRVLADYDTCKTSDPLLCAVIPRHVAVNPFLSVTVNGQESRLSLRATVRAAIRDAGGPSKPEDVLPRLKVLRPYNGKLVAVEFDSQSPAILDLMLLGGESISWWPPGQRSQPLRSRSTSDASRRMSSR